MIPRQIWSAENIILCFCGLERGSLSVKGLPPQWLAQDWVSAFISIPTSCTHLYILSRSYSDTFSCFLVHFLKVNGILMVSKNKVKTAFRCTKQILKCWWYAKCPRIPFFFLSTYIGIYHFLYKSAEMLLVCAKPKQKKQKQKAKKKAKKTWELSKKVKRSSIYSYTAVWLPNFKDDLFSKHHHSRKNSFNAVCFWTIPRV